MRFALLLLLLTGCYHTGNLPDRDPDIGDGHPTTTIKFRPGELQDKK